MSDTELNALAALVRSQSAMEHAANLDRLRDNHALAYPEVSNQWLALHKELERRGIITEDGRLI